ncbi:hypothetical protein [Gudongella oleilytica]|uniref:hypothetical protein n=1 Tax=Gudongella oleilytica TaxID=1582259 RepID=UPI000FF8811A|nr:hypothetical protein [Gudongella oleilytica]
MKFWDLFYPKRRTTYIPVVEKDKILDISTRGIEEYITTEKLGREIVDTTVNNANHFPVISEDNYDNCSSIHKNYNEKNEIEKLVLMLNSVLLEKVNRTDSINLDNNPTLPDSPKREETLVDDVKLDIMDKISNFTNGSKVEIGKGRDEIQLTEELLKEEIDLLPNDTKNDKARVIAKPLSREQKKEDIKNDASDNLVVKSPEILKLIHQIHKLPIANNKYPELLPGSHLKCQYRGLLKIERVIKGYFIVSSNKGEYYIEDPTLIGGNIKIIGSGDGFDNNILIDRKENYCLKCRYNDIEGCLSAVGYCESYLPISDHPSEDYWPEYGSATAIRYKK